MCISVLLTIALSPKQNFTVLLKIPTNLDKTFVDVFTF